MSSIVAFAQQLDGYNCIYLNSHKNNQRGFDDRIKASFEKKGFKIKLGKSAKFNNKIRVRNKFMRAKAPNISRYIQNLKTGELTRYNSLFYKKKGQKYMI